MATCINKHSSRPKMGGFTTLIGLTDMGRRALIGLSTMATIGRDLLSLRGLSTTSKDGSDSRVGLTVKIVQMVKGFCFMRMET